MKDRILNVLMLAAVAAALILTFLKGAPDTATNLRADSDLSERRAGYGNQPAHGFRRAARLHHFAAPGRGLPRAQKGNPRHGAIPAYHPD